MTRILRALTWMRYRLFVNSMMKTGRRDTLEQMSRALASILPIVIVIALVPSAIALGVGGFLGGKILAGVWTPISEDIASWILVGLRVGLLIVTVMIGLLPLVRSASGPTPGITRLKLLPIPRRVLMLSELTAGFGDPWLGLTVPLVLLLAVGLLVAGLPVAAMIALAAALSFVFALAAINAGTALGMTLLFSNKRRAEWVTIAFVTVLSLTLVLPGAFPDFEERLQQGPPADMAGKPPEEKLDRLLPAFARVLPSELYVGAVKAGIAGDTGRGLIMLGGLFIWFLVVAAAVNALHRRLHDAPAGGSTRRAGKRKEARRIRIPGMNAAASAVAAVTALTALRTVRGKVAVYLNVPILSVLLVLLKVQETLPILENSPIGLGHLGAMGGFFLSVVSMQPILLNLFAIDGAGLTLQFLAPVSRRDLMLGKVVGGLGLTLVSAGLCTVASLVIAPGKEIAIWVAVVLIGISTLLLTGPFFAFLSAVLPKHADLSRLGKPGNPHNLAAFIGFFAIPLLMLPPVGLAAIALFLLEQPAMVVGLPALWTVLAAVLFMPLLRLASSSFQRRAENLSLVAVGR